MNAEKHRKKIKDDMVKRLESELAQARDSIRDLKQMVDAITRQRDSALSELSAIKKSSSKPAA